MAETRLPKFDNPPVVEVALSISFEPLQRFRSAHAGRLWEKIRDRFPITEDQPELAPATEEPSAPAAPPRFEVMDRPRIRTWFQSADGTQLLQLQHDRIAYNWKRGPESQPYPSYEEVERRFLELLPIVIDFIGRENLGNVVPTQAELTYVNHIHERHDQIERAIAFWRGMQRDGFLPPVEDARFAARYVIREAGKMIGRLVAEMQPAYISSTREEVLSLNMIARGRPGSSDIDGAMRFLRVGHEWIVRGFAEITTPEMHEKWKRTQ